jgi:hypothetical protein
MRLVHRLLCILLLSTASATASAAAFHPDLSAVASIPLYSADSASVAKSVATAQASKSQPLRFAVAAPLAVDLSQGVWSTDGDIAVWRVRVSSPGARSLGLEFSKFAMPAGGALYVYDAAGTLVQGPYTRAAQSAEGKLWTALVQSDLAVIEARMPVASRSAFALTLANVDHGYLDFDQVATASKALNSLSGTQAGSCEINVVCTQGDPWRSEIRSVGAITINNQTVCSGTLINDIPQDGTPYFLTANHCGINTTALASSTIFYWNYQASTCSGNDGSLTQNQAGASLIAGDVGSDFTLLRLSAKPASSYDLYYAGFDASGNGATSGVSLHHPEGDIQKISTFSTAVTQQLVPFSNDDGTSRTVQAWQVQWASGVTEPGSSGSGLWNQNHQIIGVLSGGNSSCSTPTDDDYYGRLGVAWTANAAASGQLKAWLDPGNTGQTAIAGAEASSLGSGTTTGTTTGGVVSSPGGFGSGSGGAFPPALLVLLASLAWRRRRD